MNAPASTTRPSETDVRSVAFVSLGCPKNTVDSEKMLGLLAEDGLEIISEQAGGMSAGADAVVVNTCGFLEASRQESLEVVHEALRLKEQGRVKRVIVAGCLVQRHRARILDWAPGVDAMIGVFDRYHIVDAVRGARPERQSLEEASDKPKYWIAGNALQAAKDRRLPVTGLTVHGKDGKGLGYFESDNARLRITPRHFAYLRVSEGCNQACAFCTIPSIRGKMRSKPLERIAAEARELLEDGAFELNLIGQDTTSWGDDIGQGVAAGAGLPAMLRAVNDAVHRHAGGSGWVRLMYAYPSNFSDEMIEAIAELDRVVKYIDIPLQHASDRMLTAMRRTVTAAHQRDLMLRLRERIPGIAIRTTFITGFPGETEEDHEALLEFVDEIGFDMMGVFEYSREDGTPAGTMEKNPALAVPAEVKARRKDELMRLQQSIAFDQADYIASQFDEGDPENTGCRFDVLIDEPGELDEEIGLYSHRGRAYFQAPMVDSTTTVFSKNPLSAGELVRCTIVGADGYDLIAQPTTDLERRLGLTVLR
ncbi:MAG: 30S ribosomal protein S12 methylthiotransferase RimO [Planctomycetota bacterium]|nr:30S ribosomal protein S12 methylthiotransferase RimO [Planctomycetota bacterium]